jgi:hypothetical protein
MLAPQLKQYRFYPSAVPLFDLPTSRLQYEQEPGSLKSPTLS